MKVGDDGDPEFEAGWPARRRHTVARDIQPKNGCAKAVGRRGEAGGTKPGQKSQEMTTRKQGVFHS
jgi:hypothetical protein